MRTSDVKLGAHFYLYEKWEPGARAGRSPIPSQRICQTHVCT
jgi:hypothetical protein